MFFMKFIYLFIITLIISCGRIPEPIPEWVTQSESNSKYWIGVGSAKDRDSAINSAMNSIASQISLQIESKMTNLKIEKNNEIINYTRNIIETRVNIYLPQVEMQKVVLHNKTWYALVELNKENYYF